jgi:quinol monooxygenase YgiN
MMRKLLFSLIALAPVALPADAQTPAPQHRLKPGYIATTYTGEVLPGQMENFKQLVTRLVAAVAAEEPGTLVYKVTLRPDQKTYDTIEVYQNSAAVVAHGKHVRAEFLKELVQVRKTVKFVVYGFPDAQAKEALAGLNPEYETPIDGFVR